jgi:hypothetical protein
VDVRSLRNFGSEEEGENGEDEREALSKKERPGVIWTHFVDLTSSELDARPVLPHLVSASSIRTEAVVFLTVKM